MSAGHSLRRQNYTFPYVEPSTKPTMDPTPVHPKRLAVAALIGLAFLLPSLQEIVTLWTMFAR